MDARQSSFRGLVCGWSLGTFEAGLALAANSHLFIDAWGWLGVPLIPILLYGWGGWIAGRLPGIGPRLPWTFLLFLGWAIVVYKRLHTALNVSWYFIPIGVALSLGLWWWSRSADSPRRRKTAGGFGLASLAVPVLFTAVALAKGSPADLTPLPYRTEASKDSPNVVLITWDTVRADSLPLYGGTGLDTPNLNRLAAEGLLFDNFLAVAPITGPSHNSILTGLYPPSHGLRSNGQAGSTSLPTSRLPEMFADAGYATGGFISGYPLRRPFGFAEGFHIYDDRMGLNPWVNLLGILRIGTIIGERYIPWEMTEDMNSNPGDLTTGRAVRWYENTDRSAFLWLHLFDAHLPYDPPKAFREQVMARISELPKAYAEEHQEALALQAAEIAYLDHLLGELLETLEAKDPGLENTIVVLTSDHGECFGEGGFIEHHRSLFDATQHIGAVIRPASGGPWKRGTRLEAPASHVDLMPTLCQLAGLSNPTGIQGVSLVPAMAQATDVESRGFYMEAWQADLGDQKMQAWWQDGWKFVRRQDGSEFLYHQDSGDTVNVAEENPERARAMAKALDEYYEQMPKLKPGDAALSARDQQAFVQLGYAGDEE
ncbi:MAG: hypothetical protein DWQ01_18420 [Planctomycetota bacterium]|nr:MAG: hypothetical protein DWQ01_18420 [Planctomycetota bacterium]